MSYKTFKVGQKYNKVISIIGITCVINILILLAFYFFLIGPSLEQTKEVSTTLYKDSINSNTTNVVSDVKNGVVTVINRTQVSTITNNGYSIEDFYNWYNDNQNSNDTNQTKIVDNAIGSGFVIKESPKYYYILTNNHVIDGAKELDIMYSDKTRSKAQLVGSMPNKDIAVLKISKTKKLKVLSFANSQDIKLGEDVIAIGSPLSTDYQQTITKGIVSKLPFVQKIDEYDQRNALQTDAAINPGNSGGPLINMQGHVIGMNTFKREDGESLGFSMPSNDIKAWANKILVEGNY